MLTTLFLFSQHVLAYFLDPIKLVSGGLHMLGLVINAVAILVTDPAAKKLLMNLGDFMVSDPLFNGEVVVLYLMSPVIDPSLFVACMEITWYGYLICAIVFLGFLVKGWVYMGGTT